MANDLRERDHRYWMDLGCAQAKLLALKWLKEQKHAAKKTLDAVVDNPNATKERIDHLTATIEAVDLAIKSIENGFIGVVPEL